MKADRLGIFSAVLASVCCLGPVLLVLLGLGSLGIGASLGRFHWWFITAAAMLLTMAWRSYVKEQRRCNAVHCEIAQGRTAKWTLLLASAVVAAFMGLNLYTYASQSRSGAIRTLGFSNHLSTVTIPVEGMTCFTCELAVEASLRRMPDVAEAVANVNEAVVFVRYDSANVSVHDLIEAINKTGYRAHDPSR